MDLSLQFQFENKNTHDIIFILEPWAVEFTIAPNSVISVNIAYSKAGLLDTEINPQYFTVWLWGGCRAEVFVDGKNLTTPFLSTPAF